MSYNDVETLEDKIGYSDDSTSEGELTEVLDAANQQMKARVGRNFIETFRIKKQVENGDLVNTIDLKFAPVFEVDEILIDRYEVIDESNYTVDRQEGTIDIDQGFVDDNFYLGQILRIEYKPQIFKQIELWRAIELVKNQEVIQLEDSEENALHRNALREAKRLENMVNRRAGPGKATDGDVRPGTK